MGTVQIDGSTPKITVGNATAEDATILFDGNAQDFYIALDDSADDLLIGLGSTVGTTPMLSFTEAKAAAFTGAVTMASTLGVTGVVTGAGFTAGSAVLAEAELELLDGLTAGTAIASKVVTTDANIDTTGQRNLTISGELDAATLDISGNADIDGTTNLDAVDIDGAVQLDATFTVGVNDTGHDVIFYGAAAGAKFFWDESADDLILAKSIFKMDTLTTTGSYAYLYRNDGDLVSTIEDAGDGVGVQLSMYNSDEDFFFRFNNTTPVLTLGASGFIFNESGNDLDFRTETSNQTHMVFVEAGTDEFNIRESAGDAVVCIGQQALDTKIMSFKSSDIAHGITDDAEADTYGFIQKGVATAGGTWFEGISEDTDPGLTLAGKHGTTTGSTSKDSAGGGAVVIRGFCRSGTGTAVLGTNENIVAIRNKDTTRFYFDAEGDFHADSSSTTFDNYEDAQLVRALDLSHGKGVIESKFDKFVAYNHENLANLQLVGREKDGTPNSFVNVTGLQRLHNGAIWQQYEKHERLLEAVYDLAKEAVGEEKANAILDKHEVKRLQ